MLNFIFLSLQITAFFNMGSVRGVVTDEETGHPMIGANLVLKTIEYDMSDMSDMSEESIGDAADNDGFYTIPNIPPGKYTLMASMIGYEAISIPVEILAGEKKRVDLKLRETVIPLENVVVEADPLSQGNEKDVSDYEIREVPGAATDLFFALQSLPGVASFGEAGPISIRGGDPQENLYLFDNGIIGSPFHMEYVAGGLFNIFDQSMLKEVNLYSGGFPAKYGDRISAVVDIHGREGSREEVKGEATLYMAGISGLLEGPMTEKGSFRLLGRMTYYDWVIGLIDIPEEFSVFPTYYDLQGRVEYDLSNNHKLTGNLLQGEDWMRVVLNEPDLEGEFNWRSRKRFSSIGLESLFSNKLFSRHTLSVMDNRWRVKLGDEFFQNIDQREFTFWEDLTWEIFPKHTLGIGFSLHPYREIWNVETLISEPSQPEDMDTLRIKTEVRSTKGALYIEDQFRLHPNLTLRLGGRLEYFEENRERVFSPRVGINYSLTPRSTIRVAWGEYSQFPNSDKLDHETGNPSLDSKKSTHWILGLDYEWREDLFSRVEVYTKNLVDLPLSDTLLNYTNEGHGFSRGIEIFLQKRLRGNTFGWVSYAYSASKRKEGDDKELLDFDYDLRHMFNLVATHKLERAWQVGLKWRYASGRPFTPLAYRIRDPVDGDWQPVWGERKSSRYPSYHRLDLRLEREFLLFGLRSVAFLEAMNLYNRQNVVMYEYNDDYSELEPFTIFPFMPVGGIIVNF